MRLSRSRIPHKLIFYNRGTPTSPIRFSMSVYTLHVLLLLSLGISFWQDFAFVSEFSPIKPGFLTH
jgi:hypothetical protein